MLPDGDGGLACLQCSAPYTETDELESTPTPKANEGTTLPEADTAKTLTTGTVPSKRQQKKESPPRYIYTYSVNGVWFSPGEITFRREHMLFLINHLPELRDGFYPPNPKETGYVDPKVMTSQMFKGAYFETPAGLAAEVDARLSKCGIDGLMVEARYCWEKSEESLAKCLGLPTPTVFQRIANALRFISGWERKQRSYREFTRHKKVGSDTKRK